VQILHYCTPCFEEVFQRGGQPAEYEEEAETPPQSGLIPNQDTSRVRSILTAPMVTVDVPASPKFAAFYSMISAENEIFSACFRL